MPDPRYRKGVHINRHTKPMPSRRRELELNGWKYSHFNEEHNRPVYTQGDAKLMVFEGDWLVEFPTYSARYQGTMAEITEDVLKELSR